MDETQRIKLSIQIQADLLLDKTLDEARKSRKPRTSDPNFNEDKTNLIVNYLPQVRRIG